MGRLSREKQQSIEEMAGEVMDIVGKVAVRRLIQVTEFVHDDMIKPLERDKALLIELVLDDQLSAAAKNLVAIAIRDGGMPPTDETRSWFKIRTY